MSIRPAKDSNGNEIPGTWIIDYYPQGRNKRVRRIYGSAEKPIAEAVALAMEMELRRQSRRTPVAKTNPRVYELLPDFKAEYKNNHEPTTVRDLEYALVHLVPFFGKLFVAEITAPLIEQYKSLRLSQLLYPAKRKTEDEQAYQLRRQEQAKPPTKRTINKELSYLSGFLGWAFDNSYSSQRQKVKLFPLKQTKPDRARPLHPLEVDAVLQHLEPQYRLTFLLLNDAGLRRSEVLGGGKYYGVRVQDIDLNFGIIYARGKGDKERVVPITTPRLRSELEKALEITKKGHLCINPKTKKPWYSIRKALIRAADKAGIDKRVYHHLLRHNFGTHAVAAGINLRTVQEIMGHSTIKTTEVYTHMAPYLQQEAEKFANFIAQTTPGNSDPDQTQQNSDPQDSD